VTNTGAINRGLYPSAVPAKPRSRPKSVDNTGTPPRPGERVTNRRRGGEHTQVSTRSARTVTGNVRAARTTNRPCGRAPYRGPAGAHTRRRRITSHPEIAAAARPRLAR
jgi:hypothetical protein